MDEIDGLEIFLTVITVVFGVLFIIGLVLDFQHFSASVDDCEARGGQHMSQPGDNVCIVNGKIDQVY